MGVCMFQRWEKLKVKHPPLHAREGVFDLRVSSLTLFLLFLRGVFDLRVSLVGDSDVGKTSISRAFTGADKIKDTTTPTIGYEFGFATRRSANGDSVRYVVVDTAGQERYSHILPNYMRDSDAVVVVYDVSSRATFDHVDRWLYVIHTRLPCDTPTILVGNKCDRRDERDVSWEEGRKKAESHNMYFLESSAKTGEQIHRIFDFLAIEIRDKKLHEMFHGSKKRLSEMAFKLPPAGKKKKFTCASCSQ
ncbi:Ras-related protein Rab-15 [Elysia marginata]|uniref:Ras-related protein Rab-15 n=1 Tax=Elysia marginata TaxID=1093978 RepID=A0AAV4I6H6_9GAST|nr:Ras-related protein Rab-15 [Elysia marginata]